jgi:hypothetical protein
VSHTLSDSPPEVTSGSGLEQMDPQPTSPAQVSPWLLHSCQVRHHGSRVSYFLSLTHLVGLHLLFLPHLTLPLLPSILGFLGSPNPHWLRLLLGETFPSPLCLYRHTLVRISSSCSCFQDPRALVYGPSRAGILSCVN